MGTLIRTIIFATIILSCNSKVYVPELPKSWEKIGDRSFYDFYSSNYPFPKESFYVCKIGEKFSSIGNKNVLYPTISLDSFFIYKIIRMNLDSQSKYNYIHLNLQSLFNKYSFVEGTLSNEYLNYIQFKDGKATYIGTGNPRLKPSKIIKIENDTLLFYDNIDEKNQSKHKYLNGFYHFIDESRNFVQNFNSDENDFTPTPYSPLLDSSDNYLIEGSTKFPIYCDSMPFSIYLGDPKSYNGKFRFSSFPPFYSVSTKEDLKVYSYNAKHFNLYIEKNGETISLIEYFVIESIDKSIINRDISNEKNIKLNARSENYYDESFNLRDIFGNNMIFFKIGNYSPTKIKLDGIMEKF
ncbi:MAG: hypothetical protein IPP06_05470 [Saprospiraceae bacterium]|nr:hypothetical protein [Candidatus Vicinibacter affinis]